MNKRHTGKLLAFLLAVVFMFTLVPQVFADDGEPGDPENINKWTYIHNTAGEWGDSLGDLARDNTFPSEPVIRSGLTINEVEVPEDGDDYTFDDIPEGTEFKLQIAFHFDSSSGDGNESFYHDAKLGDFFTYTLPAGVSFDAPAPSNEIKNQEGAVFATWEISGNELKVTLDGAFGDAVDPSDLWGVVGITGKFDAIEDDDETQTSTQIKLGDQTVFINREQSSGGGDDPLLSSLSKSHKYNPGDNTITWIVELKLPDGEESKDYAGYQLIDQLTGNHSYVGGTFKVGKDLGHLTEMGGSDLQVSGKELVFTFPDGEGSILSEGESIFVQYETKIDGISPGESADNNFKNTANLKRGSDLMAGPAESTFSMGGFFSKAAGNLEKEGNEYYIKWTVKLTIKKTTGYTYSFDHARLVDLLSDMKHEYADNKGVTILFPEQSVETLTDAPGGDYGYFEIEEYPKEGTEAKDTYLIYHFPSGQPTSSQSADQVYELTYYTRIIDWDNNLDDNTEVKVSNLAWFEWGKVMGDGGPSGPGGSDDGFGVPAFDVEKTVKPAGGLIKKTANPSGTVDYVHNDTQYIRWEITVNDNAIEMDWNTVSIGDALIIGNNDGVHELEISTDRPLEVYRKGTTSPVATFDGISDGDTTAGTNYKLKKDGNGFILSFQELQSSKDTYTIAFFTKIKDDDPYNSDNNAKGNGKSIVYRNNASLSVGENPSITVKSTKTLRFQMLQKTGVSSSFNPVDRKLQYSLVVNRNRVPLKNATITDILPEGMTLQVGSIEVQTNGSGDWTSLWGGSLTTGVEIRNDDDELISDNAFTIALPDTVEGLDKGDQYTIKFWVYLEDSALLTTDPSFENVAELKLDGAGKPFSSNDVTAIDYKTITKGHDYPNGDDKTIVTWTVEINPGKVYLKDAKVWDTLDPNLELVEKEDGSPYIELYKADVATNGTLTEGDQVTLSSDNVRVSVVTGSEGDPDRQNFEVDLPDGEEAYILIFKTHIVKDKVTIKNTISLTGESSSPTGSADSTDIVVSDLYSYGGSGSKSLTFIKTDNSNEPQALEGAKFQLLTDNYQPFKYRGDKSNTQVSISDGSFVFDELPNWIFYLKEIEPAENHLIPTTENGDVKIFGPYKPSDYALHGPEHIVNAPALADVTIMKMDFRENEGDREGLGGAKFSIVSTVAGGYTDEVLSGDDGVVEFENVPLGTYTIQEIESPAGGYKAISGTLTVTVDYNDDFTDTVVEFVEPSDPDIVWDGEHYVFINRFMGKIEIIKVGETDNLLEDVGFRLLVKDGEGFKEYLDADNYGRQGKTGPDGTLIFDELPPGEYYLEEISAPDEYVLPGEDELVEVIIPSEGIYHIQKTLTNELLRAFIQVSKEGPNGEMLDGGLFELTKPGDTSFQAKRMPAEEGVVTFEELLPGTYQIEEIEPPFGYAINEESKIVEVELRIDEPNQLFDIKAGGEGSNTIKNDYDGKIIIKKTGASGALKDVTFELLQIPEGSTEPTDVVGTQTTDEEGIVEFTGLPLGTYYVRETAAPRQYHLPSTLHEFVLTTEVDEENETVGWHQELELRNYLLTDSIILTKTDPKGVALDGGWFGLYTNSAATGDPMDKVQADGGQVVFSGILPGTYYVREIEAPAGYIKSDEIIKVNVSLAGTNGIVGEVVKEPLVNTWAGGIKLVKVDEKGEPLAGAVFELLDANKKVIKEGTSGKDGVIEFKELAMGTYYLREKIAPAGYAKLMELTEVVLKAGAEADMVKTVKLANHRNLASVTLRKTNQYDGLVSGGLFGIYKTDDTGFKNPLQKVASVKGMITFTDLEAGQYFIREIEAPKHHKRTDEFVKVVLEVNPDTGLLEDLEIEEPLLNETPLTEEEWDEIVEGDEEEKDNGEKDDDLVETGSFFDTAMLWFFGTLLILAGAILLLRMRAALVRK